MWAAGGFEMGWGRARSVPLVILAPQGDQAQGGPQAIDDPLRIDPHDAAANFFRAESGTRDQGSG